MVSMMPDKEFKRVVMPFGTNVEIFVESEKTFKALTKMLHGVKLDIKKPKE